MNSQMPKINLEQIKTQVNAEDFELIKGIVASRGKNKGCLRASKPKVTMHKMGTETRTFDDGFSYERDIIEPDAKQGATAYIWRMVAFSVSPISQHHCMPCTADFSIPGTWSDKKDTVIPHLDSLVDIIVKTVPIEKHYGTMRWGRALGAF